MRLGSRSPNLLASHTQHLAEEIIFPFNLSRATSTTTDDLPRRQDGCPQVRGRDPKEEAVRRDSLPAACPLLGGENPPLNFEHLTSRREVRKNLVCFAIGYPRKKRIFFNSGCCWARLRRSQISLTKLAFLSRRRMMWMWHTRQVIFGLVLSCYTLVELC
jgi:hypothetical protein